MRFSFIFNSLFLLSFISCGKEISNSGNEKRVTEQAPLISNAIELKYKMNENNRFYTIPRAGWAVIPEQPIVVAGKPESFRSSIFFNTNTLSITSEVESIRCDYSSIKVDNEEFPAYEHYFKGCYASIYSYEEEVNYKPGQEILLDPGKQIIFSVVLFDEKEDIEIASEIEIDWH